MLGVVQSRKGSRLAISFCANISDAASGLLLQYMHQAETVFIAVLVIGIQSEVSFRSSLL